MCYSSSARTEFYSDTGIEIAPADMAIRLLTAAGVELGGTAKSAATLFQEAL